MSTTAASASRIPPSLKLTYHDYLLLPEDSNRYEIIDGELYMTPSPATRHQRISKAILILLDRFVREKKLGEVFHAPIDVLLSDVDVVVPDLVFVSTERAKIVTEKNIDGSPDLIIEILSPSTAGRDRDIKLKRYAKFKVPEYWIVDPNACSVEIFRLAAKGYNLHASGRRTGALASPTFPGFGLDLRALFP